MNIVTHLPRVTASKRIPNGFNAWLQESLDNQTMLDKLQLFENEQILWVPDSSKFSVLQWWTKDSQQLRYPKLSCLAYNLLTIPAMSASMERIFSECKLTCLRHSTLPESLRKIQLLQSWLHSTVLDGIQLVSLWSM